MAIQKLEDYVGSVVEVSYASRGVVVGDQIMPLLGDGLLCEYMPVLASLTGMLESTNKSYSILRCHNGRRYSILCSAVRSIKRC